MEQPDTPTINMRSHQIWGQTSLPNKIFETTNYNQL